MFGSLVAAAGLASIVLAPGSAQAQAQAQAAPCSTPEYRQLDFWAGDWGLEFDQQNGGVGTGTNRITKDEYGSCVITEHFAMPGGFSGVSVSIYDPQLRTWRQTWVDNAGGVFVLTGGPVTGQDHIFEMRTVDRGPSGANRRMIWQDVTADRLTWRWQRETTEGQWVDMWVIRYRKRA
ncbi:MAG TPA: DUF1579 family protein [Brevundimonas sp.]|nr:DUF1579 family protein [Brevundimonas sp.]